eukprot:2163623-Amphidinium_carterae.1
MQDYTRKYIDNNYNKELKLGRNVGNSENAIIATNQFLLSSTVASANAAAKEPLNCNILSWNQALSP